MDKIKKYLEFVFSDFEATPRVIELKEEIQANLMEKMNDYIAEGIKEGEASLKAISSLGNIEDVLKEIGVELNQVQEDNFENVIEDAFNDRKKWFRKGSLWISLGVFLCIMSIGFGSLASLMNNGVVSILAFFIPIIFAIPMFIIAGVVYFNVDEDQVGEIISAQYGTVAMKQWVMSHKQQDQSKQIKGGILIATGVVLCIIGLVIAGFFDTMVVKSSNNVEGFIFMVFVGLGVVCFIQAGLRYFSLTTKAYLQEMVEKHPVKISNRTNRGLSIINVIDGIVFPLIAILYVAGGLFVSSQWWYIGWVLFPIYAIVSDGAKGIIKVVVEK